MKVKVIVLGILADKLNSCEFDLELREGARLKELISKILTRLDHDGRRLIVDNEGRLKRYINILVNGIEAEALEGMNTVLNEGDRVAIVPIAGGG